MHRYHKLGNIPRKRHTILRKNDGGIFYEELKGNKGFSGPSSLLYHTHRPTRVKSSKLLKEVKVEPDPDKSLRMRHIKTAAINPGGSASLNRMPILFNEDVVLSLATPEEVDSFYFCNSQADEIIFVVEGGGILESNFGEQEFRKGDYIVIPRSITYRLLYNEKPQRFLFIEANSEIRTPTRYRNEYGQIIERSPYSERDFRVPEKLITIDLMEDTPVIIKQRDVLTEVIMDHHPFDVVGWDGYYYPYIFNIEDFEPIVGRIHEPPPVHQTFQADNFVICSFCPRPYDFDEQAIPAPYHHRNVMSDEVLFYASDKFMSRKGIEYGSVTLHPDGLVHGPHPGKTEESIGKKFTDELAVMVDTFRPLVVAKDALKYEDQEYSKSWLE